MTKKSTESGAMRDAAAGAHPTPARAGGSGSWKARLKNALRRNPALRSRVRSAYMALRRAPRSLAWRWSETLLMLRPAPTPQGPPAPERPTRDAVVFSSYVPTEQALVVGRQFLEVFKHEFADCDFFVGINTGSLPAWESALKESGLRVTLGEVEPRLTVDSDASGFQRALQLMKDRDTEYRLVWFGHTKGATNDDPALRRQLIRDFYLQRRRITRLFEQPRVGSFGHYMTVNLNGARPEDDAAMDALFPFPFTRIGMHYLHTFYVYRGSIVKGFLEGCSPGFFTKHIVRDLGFDRYFFEGDFSRLADRFGYYPLYRERMTLPTSTTPVTRGLVRSVYRDWERQLPASMRTKIRFP